MPERVVKNKRKGNCHYCGNTIITDYKVKWKSSKESRRSIHYHLSCYNKSILYSITTYKNRLKESHKAKRKLKKYSRYLILENLEK